MQEGDKYFNNLVTQLSSNPQTWQVLLDNGVTEETELEVEFLYYAPTKDKAELLKATLGEYGYSVSIKSSGTLLKRQWLVEGKTTPTTLTLAKLNQWVKWMVVAGEEYSSDFDGWGVSV
jgi:hypothetical protein